MHIYRKKWFWRITIPVVLVIVVFIFKVSIFRFLGAYLDASEKPRATEYACVLSGNPYDRASYAASLYKKGLIKQVICTGGNPDFDLQAWGIMLTESKVTRRRLIIDGVDSSAIVEIPMGTSTLEESYILTNYCKQKHIPECAIISSKFHCRRIKNTFLNKMEKAGIIIHIWGAPSNTYDEKNWWKSEYGLLALNNEYVKLIYYKLKY